MEKLLTRKAVAEILNVSTRTLDRLVAAGELPSYKFGDKRASRRRFSPEEVRLFIERKSDA